jgi:hypothetical protein
MLFMEMISSHSESHTEHTNLLPGKMKFSDAKAGCKYNSHCAAEA